MANVKTRSGIVRNAAGAALAGKTATLKNHATGATIGGAGLTDANGRYTFASLDETVRYQVEVAVGGGSGQIHVNSPISPDLDHAYVNSSLRTASGATVAFGGAASFGGAVSVTGALSVTGHPNFTGAGTIMEIGAPGTASSVGIDFHSSANVNDFDSRILATGGVAGVGGGTLALTAATTQIAGAATVGTTLTVTGATAIGGGLTTTNLLVSSNATVTGTLTAAAKGHTLGTAGGTGASAAVLPADANVKLYDFGSGNWSGIGSDGSGNLWFRVGNSGSPIPAVRITASNQGFTAVGPGLVGGGLTVNGGLNVTTSGATIAGGLNVSSGNLTVGNNMSANTIAGSLVVGTFGYAGGLTVNGGPLVASGVTATLGDTTTGDLTVADTFRHNGIGLAFFGVATRVRTDVAGSRGGNVALANLLTTLANYGLITNSTT